MNCSEFNVFVENYILELKNENKSNDIRKVRVFAGYIKKYASDNNSNILDLFRDLDGDFLLVNILSYITDETPTQNVAAEYRRIVVKFCKNLCEKYELKNDFFNDVAKQTDFNELSSDFFGELRESENIICLPFEELEKLKDKIDYYLNMENFEAAIISSIENPNCQSKYNYYNKLVSIIAVKLVEYFGLSNDTIAKLKNKELNIQDRLLCVNGFQLYLKDDLKSFIELYLRFRQMVVIKINKDVDELLISNVGKPYLDVNGHADNNSLFALLKEALNTYSATKLQYRTIIDLVEKGSNIELLHQLTGTTSNTIAKICIGEKEEFERIFAPKVTKIPKGYFRCPKCEKMKEATSEKAVMLKYPSDNTLYLCCRECGEKVKAQFGGRLDE